MLASNSNVRPTFEEAGPPDKHDSLEMLFERTPIERAVPGKTIIFEGDRAEHVFAVYSGDLRICRQLNDGRRVITGFLAAGDIVGVSFKNRYLYSVEAINEVLFQRQSRNSFERRLQSSPQLRPFVLSKLCDEVAAAQDQMVLLSCKSAEERVCAFLLAQLRRSVAAGGEKSLVNLPMTRLDIADYLGMTIETVSRTITKLAGQGILAADRRHEIVVLKKSLLVDRAGKEDANAHEDTDELPRRYRH